MNLAALTAINDTLILEKSAAADPLQFLDQMAFYFAIHYDPPSLRQMATVLDLTYRSSLK